MLLAALQHNKQRALVALLMIGSVAGGWLALHSPAPMIQTAPPVIPVAPIQPTVEIPDSTSKTILELFSPSDIYLTRQLNETALSQQIEQIITTSFVLTHCNIITTDDYRDNFRALIVYAQHMHLAPDATTAEAKVRLIAQSASTSYSLVYSRTPCNDPTLPHLAEQLLTWQQAYLNN